MLQFVFISISMLKNHIYLDIDHFLPKTLAVVEGKISHSHFQSQRLLTFALEGVPE